MVSSRNRAASEAASNKSVRPSPTDLKSEADADTKHAHDDDNDTKPMKRSPLSKKQDPAQLQISTQISPTSFYSPATYKTKSAQGARKKNEKTYCICKGADNGTPMIKCEGPCNNWCDLIFLSALLR